MSFLLEDFTAKWRWWLRRGKPVDGWPAANAMPNVVTAGRLVLNDACTSGIAKITTVV